MNLQRIKYVSCVLLVFFLTTPYCQADTISPQILGVPIKTIFERLLRLMLELVGGLALLALIFAGIFFAISTGDPQRQQQAKRMIIFVIEGLFVILLSYSLLSFLDKLLVGNS
jgi:hypothetical protein